MTTEESVTNIVNRVVDEVTEKLQAHTGEFLDRPIVTVVVVVVQTGCSIA